MRGIDFNMIEETKPERYPSQLPLWAKLLTALFIILLVILVALSIRYADPSGQPWYDKVY